MTNKLSTRKITTLNLSDLDIDLELTHTPNNDPEVIKTDDKIIVGYLVQDSDCENPLEHCDGVGKIHSLSRNHRNHMSSDEAVSILESDPDTVPLSYYEHGQCLWDVCNGPRISRCPDKQWDQVEFAGVWVPDDSCREHIASSAIKGLLPEGVDVSYKSQLNKDGTVKMLADGKTPDPQYFNVITLTMPDGKTYKVKGFEAGYRKAACMLKIKVNKSTLAAGRRNIAIECAVSACEQYTAWSNGDCYGVCVDVFDLEGEKIEDDACWGYVGGKYAEETMREEMQDYAKKP